MTRAIYYHLLFCVFLIVAIYRWYGYFNEINPVWAWRLETVLVLIIFFFELLTSPRWLIMAGISLAALFGGALIFVTNQWPFGLPLMVVGSACAFLVPALRVMSLQQHRRINIVLVFWNFLHWLLFIASIYHHSVWRLFFLTQLILLPVIVIFLLLHLIKQRKADVRTQ